MNKLILSLFLFFFLQSTAQACAVCGFGQDGTAGSFITTTIILTFLPLTAFAGIIYYIVKRYKKINDEA